jgi:hypothetical protein
LQLELNKLFGLSGSLTLDQLSYVMEVGIDAQFSLRLPTGIDVLYSFIYIPITKHGTPPADGYMVNAKWPLGSTRSYSTISDRVAALHIELSPVNLNIDWNALKSNNPRAQSDVDMEVERFMPDVFEALTRFCEAYRHAKYEVDSENGRDLPQAIDATRRMTDWEFRTGLCYQITDGPNEIARWAFGGKTRGWDPANTPKLRTLMQQHMSEGVDFVKSRLFDAEESLYDGNLPMAVVNAVIALEAALSDFVQDQWKNRGVSKSRIEEAEKDISLSLMLNIELTALTPETNKPQAELLGKLNHARRLRNDIIHNMKQAVSYKEARESIESLKQLLSYLKSLS